MNDDDNSDDFASAAMLRLIRLGLARQGLALDWPAPPPAAARVPLRDKRALLNGLLARHGATAVFRLGEAVLDAPDEPALTALLAARDPVDLVQRFQRLERYVHSRHRVVIEAAPAGQLRLRHRSRLTGQPPQAAEDLVVWGLLVGVMQRLGVPGLVTTCSDGTAVLDLRWTPAAAPSAPPRPSRADTLAAARARLAADCGAAWTLPRLAAALDLAPRTLQRRLAEAGSGFSALWTEVRLAAAGRLLAEGTDSAAQIGYLCGFADQAHFTRCFHHHVALTPARYRREFASGR